MKASRKQEASARQRMPSSGQKQQAAEWEIIQAIRKAFKEKWASQVMPSRGHP